MKWPVLLPGFVATGAGQWLAERLASGLDASLVGAEHVPRRGAALLVGNHALFGVDSLALTALLARDVGRTPRFLGERNLWRIPGLRRLLDVSGAIAGEPDDAVRLLEGGELVLVYPGGIDDSFKLTSEAYTLKWGKRAGFARVALRAGAPIVPIAATGVDELFDVRRREATVGRRLFGSARYDIPLPERARLGRVPLVFHALAPIVPEGAADDAASIARLRDRAHDALEATLAVYRASRSKQGP